jgi:hypothetical protein
MIRRSDISVEVTSVIDGVSTMSARHSLYGELRGEVASEQEMSDELRDAAIRYVYGGIIEKLERLSRELPMEITFGSPNDRLQVHERLRSVVAEVKESIGMR